MERARALLPKISGTSARHLQMTRARNLRVDTRGLPEAVNIYKRTIESICDLKQHYNSILQNRQHALKTKFIQILNFTDDAVTTEF